MSAVPLRSSDKSIILTQSTLRKCYLIGLPKSTEKPSPNSLHMRVFGIWHAGLIYKYGNQLELFFNKCLRCSKQPIWEAH